MTDSTSTESTIPPEKIEAFMQFRPAVRIVYYTITPDGDFKVMLGKHQKNQELTLPGGRFDPDQDLELGVNLLKSLFRTLIREVREELNEVYINILEAILLGNFQTLGVVLWKHPDKGTSCLDFITAIYCPEELYYDLSHQNDLDEIVWVDWYREKENPSPYSNVSLAIEMLDDFLFYGTRHDEIYYDLEKFKKKEFEKVRDQLREILS